MIIFLSNLCLYMKFYYVFAFAFEMHLICTMARMPVSENYRSDTI